MTKDHVSGARREVPRSRGAVSGLALIVLGAWGALIPFVGPYFNFSFTPDDAWHWTTARGWLEVLPGAAAFLAGVLLLTSRSRSTTLLAAWIGTAAGAWFAVGPQLQTVWHIGSPGQPAGSGAGIRALEVLALFPLLGVVIVYFAASAFGRLSVVSTRDQKAAERREAEAESARERGAAAAQEAEASAAHEREAYAAQQREAGAAQEREAGAAQEREAGAAQEREATAARQREQQAEPAQGYAAQGYAGQGYPAQEHTPSDGPQHAATPQDYGRQAPSEGASVAGGQPAEQGKPQGWLQRTLHRN